MSPQTIARVENPANGLIMLRTMAGLGIICALLIVLTYEGTFERIRKNRAEALEKAIYEVLPGAVSKRSYIIEPDNTLVEAGENAKGRLIHAGYNNAGELVGIAIEASGMGYADIIRVLYGYDPDREIVIGLYVLESKETPGLGDKISKDEDFVANFKSLDVALTPDGAIANPVTTVKHGSKTNPWEVDGITGATISSRAIGDLLRASTDDLLPVIRTHLEQLKSNSNAKD